MSLDFNKIVKQTNYPSGEFHLQLVDPLPLNNSIIVANITDFNGLIKCLIADRALKAQATLVRWAIPFFPFARDDRRNSQLDCNELQVAIDIAKELDAVIVDPHSDVSGVLKHFPQKEVVREFANNGLFSVRPVVAIPDAGAAKKAYSWIDEYELPYVQCLKRRDPATGKLSGFQVVGDPSLSLAGKDIIIVDDICDGGGTFLGLAEELKKENPNSLRLAVTHGLFTKGLKELSSAFSRIYTLDHFDPPWTKELIVCSLDNIIERGNIV